MLDAVSKDGSSKKKRGTATTDEGDTSQEGDTATSEDGSTGKKDSLAKKLESRLSPDALRQLRQDLTPYLLTKLEEISRQTTAARGLRGVFAGAGEDVRRSIRGVQDTLRSGNTMTSIDRLKGRMTAATSWSGPEKADLYKVLQIISYLINNAPTSTLMVFVGASEVGDRDEVVPSGEVDDDAS